MDLTTCDIRKGLLLFALPMILGDLLQQVYNLSDTLIVGRFIGSNALAAVGSAYALMTFLTSIFLGLSMGAGVLFSMEWGRGNIHRLQLGILHAFCLIILITILMNIALYVWMDPILHFLAVPQAIYDSMRIYVEIIFMGLLAVSIYNFFACLLRSIGNSVIPLVFLGLSAGLNIGLDLLFVLGFHWGIAGAAIATILAQYVSGSGISMYYMKTYRSFILHRQDWVFDPTILHELLGLSLMTCLQQSCMNFGILLVQRLVDTFGPITMAAFAAGVKIDTFAYLPVQDFGNAFSIFISQNEGAKRIDRQQQGFRIATTMTILFSAVISLLVFVFAQPLMQLFVQAKETEVLWCGIRYLHIEGTFYMGIGCLFLLYGYFRGMARPGISVILTILSLGTRVLLAYALAPTLGEIGIWMAIPIGWFLADLVGFGWYFMGKTKINMSVDGD